MRDLEPWTPLRDAGLQTLIESSRLVGIISHAAQRRDRRDKQIRVTKGISMGSSAEVAAQAASEMVL